MSKLLTLFVCVSALVCTHGFAADEPAPGEDEGDLVVRVDGKAVPRMNVEIDTFIQVKGKKGNTPLPAIAGHLIKDIIREKADANYGEALRNMEAGKYRVAARYFQLALEAMAGQKWAQEYCNYGLGNAIYMEGEFKGFKGNSGTKYDTPASYFRKALEANDKSRFLPDILVKLPVCLVEEGKYDEANAAFADSNKKLQDYSNEIFKTHSTRDPGKRAIAALALTEARIATKLAEGGKAEWGAAKVKWDSARTKCAEYPELAGEAFDGIVKALLSMKAYDDARNTAESITDRYKKDSDPKLIPLLPSAYFAIGRANFEKASDFALKGNKQQANKHYAEARWAFTRVLAQFFDNDEFVEQAYYWSGTCYEMLKDIEPDAQEKAVRQWKFVVEGYPKGAWKEQAQKELNRVLKTEGAPKLDQKKEEPKKDAAKPKEEPKKDAPKPKEEPKKDASKAKEEPKKAPATK